MENIYLNEQDIFKQPPPISQKSQVVHKRYTLHQNMIFSHPNKLLLHLEHEEMSSLNIPVFCGNVRANVCSVN